MTTLRDIPKVFQAYQQNRLRILNEEGEQYPARNWQHIEYLPVWRWVVHEYANEVRINAWLGHNGC